MSKICIGVIPSLFSEYKKQMVVETIESWRKRYGHGVFFYIKQDEPILQEYNKPYLAFSLADTEEYNNCEFLFLPDNCTFNGKVNNVTFNERMERIQQLFSELGKIVNATEFFVGDSGDLIEEYQHVRIDFNKFFSFIITANPDENYHFSMS